MNVLGMAENEVLPPPAPFEPSLSEPLPLPVLPNDGNVNATGATFWADSMAARDDGAEGNDTLRPFVTSLENKFV